MLKYVLLGALSYQPLTGYQLKQFIDTSAGHFWHAQTSQIYRTLDALEKDALLVSQIEPQDDKPDRRTYTITAAGKADLLAWLKQPMTEIVPTKDELLVRLFFGIHLDKDSLLTLLRVQKALHEQELIVLRDVTPQHIQAGVEQYPERKRDAILWDASRRLGQLGEETYIRWLDETIQRIEAEF